MIRDGDSSDPGSGIRDGKKSDPGSGLNIPDPQHWSKHLLSDVFHFFCSISKFVLADTDIYTHF